MVKCPECKKEFSTPVMDFRAGKEDTGNSFTMQYAHVLVVIFAWDL